MSSMNRLRSVLLSCTVVFGCLCLSACGEDTIKNADVQITAYLKPMATLAQNSTILTLPSGTQVTLNKAYIALNSVELIPCQAQGLSDSGGHMKGITQIIKQPWGRKLGKNISSWLFAEVYAHSGSTPTFSGIPYWLDLTASQEQFMGVLYPPVNHYCTLELTFSRADDDTQFVLASDVYAVEQSQNVGNTFVLEGSYRLAGTQLAERFSIVSRKNLPQVNIPLEPEALVANPLLTLELSLDLAGWLAATEPQWRAGNTDEALLELANYWR